MSDERDRKCVAELIKDFPTRLYPVGRLDRESEGLLLMTNDGAFANEIIHPCLTLRQVAAQQQTMSLHSISTTRMIRRM